MSAAAAIIVTGFGFGLLAALAIARPPAQPVTPAPTPAPTPAAQHQSPNERIELIGEATIPADASDLSGLTGEMPSAGGPIPASRLGSMGSAIDWMGPGASNRWLMASDRGPLDGGVDYPLRWHVLEFTLPATSGEPSSATVPTVAWKVVSTTILSGPDGAFTGLAARFNRAAMACSRRLDPEGVRVLPGTAGEGAALRVLLSDEYAPSVRLFDAQGVQIKAFLIPEPYGIARADANPDNEDAMNAAGRVANRGFEGLALSPDGRLAVAVPQSPLLQDGGKMGRFVRLLRLELGTGASTQIVYPLGDSNYVLSEGLWLDEHRLLTIERDGQVGKRAGFKAIMLADTRGCSDVSGLSALPRRSLPGMVMPARTRVLIDLLDDRFRLAGANFPEKIEGLCWGPTMTDGRRVLVVASDNDLLPEQPTRVWFFAVPMKVLEP